MTRSLRSATAVLVSLLLTACGGGGGATSTVAVALPTCSTPSPAPLAALVSAPVASGNTATDGFNWFNYRRQQLGLNAVSRNAQIDTAAQGHSSYQAQNQTITHVQISGNPGFTAAELADTKDPTTGAVVPGRFTVAGYTFAPNASFAFGEVISATSDSSGKNAAEDLITAIYHRFVIFEPSFKEAGAGAAVSASGISYFTTDFASNNGLGVGVGSGRFASYPAANQSGVPTLFFSDQEIPDPVPNQNLVGYPISVHADILATLTVGSFVVQPHGGSPLSVKLLAHVSDPETPASAAAIIPLTQLASGTTYDVAFSGTIDNQPVCRNWSFTTG